MSYASDQRDEMIKGLRELLNMIESNPHSPLPYALHFQAFGSYRPDDSGNLEYVSMAPAHVREVMAVSPGHWSKHFDDYALRYRRQLSTNVKFELVINRENVCRKVETGEVKHVEAYTIEAHDEPVYEWVCNEPLPTVEDA